MNANQHSRMGAWSLGLSMAVGAIFLALLPSVRAFAVAQANETSDAPGLSLLISFSGLALLLLNLVALGLGVVGSFQRHRKRTFAFLGIAVSILVIELFYTQALTW